MPIQKDDSGRRWVQVEVEVPGTPEEVWSAIATGPGIGSWFVPTRFETDAEGTPVRAVADFGPGMESVSTVTEWSPPQRLAADSQDLGPDAPSVATEWIVEARDGGTCVVRVVHSLFASTDDWDDQLEAWEGGWPDFFRILRLYLAHFGGQPCVLVQLQSMPALDRSAAWARLSDAIGCAGATVGDERSLAEGELSATVERTGEPGHPEQLLLRLADPTPGIAHVFAMSFGEQTVISLRFYFYGEQAESVAGAQEPRWRNRLDELFPVPDPAAAGEPG